LGYKVGGPLFFYQHIGKYFLFSLRPLRVAHSE
jgi:hypothetical protein